MSTHALALCVCLANPWKFGNEYHDAGCAMSYIIWCVNLKEDKDERQHLGKKEHDNKRLNDWDAVALNTASVGNRKDCGSRFWLLCFTGTNRIEEERSLCSCPHKKGDIGKNMFLVIMSSLISPRNKWVMQMPSVEN